MRYQRNLSAQVRCGQCVHRLLHTRHQLGRAFAAWRRKVGLALSPCAVTLRATAPRWPRRCAPRTRRRRARAIPDAPVTSRALGLQLWSAIACAVLRARARSLAYTRSMGSSARARATWTACHWPVALSAMSVWPCSRVATFQCGLAVAHGDDAGADHALSRPRLPAACQPSRRWAGRACQRRCRPRHRRRRWSGCF